MNTGAPLTHKEFLDALQKGLGRAAGHVRAAPAESLREPLLYACTHNLVHDPLCECARVPWNCKLVKLTGESDWYCAETLKLLEGTMDSPEGERDACSLDFLIYLLAAFAMDDHPEVKESLRRKIFSCLDADGSFFADIPPAVFGVDGAVEMLRRYSRMEESEFGTIRALAEQLIGATAWHLWWD